MNLFFLKPIRMIALAIVEEDTPRQLAWGVTLGMIAGLMPKDNLLAWIVALMLFVLNVNISIGLVSLWLFSLLGPYIDTFTDKIGLKILSIQAMQEPYAALYNMPLGAWLGFDNTVVLGTLVFGLYLAYPLYWVSLILFRVWQPRATVWIRRYWMTRVLLGVDITSRLGVM